MRLTYSTGDPRNSRTFYLRICLFTLVKLVQNDNFLVKMYFLYANSEFAVQNKGTHLPRITRETCTKVNLENDRIECDIEVGVCCFLLQPLTCFFDRDDYNCGYFLQGLA